MSNITKFSSPGQVSTYDAKMVALIRRTVASDCSDDEFNLFVHQARSLGLDPLRRQIYAFVYGKKAKDQSKRKMSIITGIDGFRSIAERTGDYRPDDDEPSIETDPDLKGPSNPVGIVKATVRVYKFSHGDWHKVTASAYWDEFAPIKEEWSESNRVEDGHWPDGNVKYKVVAAKGATKVKTLDDSGQWAKMPRLMLAKVAEALALRKAWPDNFANVYAAEEMDRAKMLDITPSEAAAEGATQERMERIGGGNRILISWEPGKPLEDVHTGTLADRVMAFIRDHSDNPSIVLQFRELNRAALRQFWAVAPGDGLELNKAFDAIAKRSVTP